MLHLYSLYLCDHDWCVMLILLFCSVLLLFRTIHNHQLPHSALSNASRRTIQPTPKSTSIMFKPTLDAQERWSTTTPSWLSSWRLWHRKWSWSKYKLEEWVHHMHVCAQCGTQARQVRCDTSNNGRDITLDVWDVIFELVSHLVVKNIDTTTRGDYYSTCYDFPMIMMAASLVETNS